MSHQAKKNARPSINWEQAVIIGLLCFLSLALVTMIIELTGRTPRLGWPHYVGVFTASFIFALIRDYRAQQKVREHKEVQR